jgi:hypothetical protein
MIAAFRLACLVLLASLAGAAGLSQTVALPETRTEFGRLQVDKGDGDTALAEGNAAFAAATRILSLPNARFVIVEAGSTDATWGSKTTDGLPIYPWAFRSSADARAMPPPAFLLRHEIGHDLFIRYLVPSTKDGQYGGDAPDWLDEMAAIAFEGDVLRTTRRRSTARQEPGKRFIPMARFLTMRHPEAAAGPIRSSAGETYPLRDPASIETGLFYATASAFHDYLLSRTGNPAIIAELASAVRRGAAVDQWLLARVHLPAPRGVAALEADFGHWIESDPRYSDVRK